MARQDPIGETYYIPLAKAEIASNIAFYLATILSIIILVLDKSKHSVTYNIVQSTFIISVFCVFASGIATRIYFAPRAQEERIKDFISNAFSVQLIHQTSNGYYNNSEPEPIKRSAASLLENTFFTKSILKHMLRNERILIVIYILAWSWAVTFRATDLDWLAVVAQVIFGEHLISRWLRMEWLRLKVEGLFKDTYNLFCSVGSFQDVNFRARAFSFLLQYEVTKSQAGISLSTPIFKKLNQNLSMEWEKIKKAARIS